MKEQSSDPLEIAQKHREATRMPTLGFNQSGDRYEAETRDLYWQAVEQTAQAILNTKKGPKEKIEKLRNVAGSMFKPSEFNMLEERTFFLLVAVRIAEIANNPGSSPITNLYRG